MHLGICASRLPETEVEVEEVDGVIPEGWGEGCAGLLLTQAAAAAATWKMFLAAAEKSTGVTAALVVVSAKVVAAPVPLPTVGACETTPPAPPPTNVETPSTVLKGCKKTSQYNRRLTRLSTSH